MSRTFLLVLLAALQIGVIVLLVYQFASYGVATYAVIAVITVLVLVGILEKDEINPAYKMMWVLIIVLMPIFGALFYVLWGHNYVPRRNHTVMQQVAKRIDPTLRQQEEVLDSLVAADPDLGQSARYLVRHAVSPVYPCTDAEYYPLGEDFFPRFLDAIKSAEKYIFMEYYILEPGMMLDTTVAILAQKAAEGVDVRLMWDGIGSLFTLPPGYDRMLQDKGIKCARFLPVRFTIHLSEYGMLNHRDHRKITVVDGKVGFTGGLNFADEYINAKERFGVWKDTALRLTGPAVYSLTTTFLRGWDFATATETDLALYQSPPARQEPACLNCGFVQPFWDSPLDRENVSENTYLNVIRHAKDYVYICTPYLILDHEMITMLGLAAKSGVDVRILTPGIPDKRPVYWVTQSYYPVLLAAGVRIFEYTPGFNHAKMYVSDDRTAIVGSANMDYRSLYLHFENCVSFYGGDTVGLVKQDMLDCFAISHEVTLEETRQIKPLRRVLQIGAKFFAPIL